MEKKELKDVEFDDKNREKFTLNITKPEHFPDPKKVQRFKQNSKLYCKSLKEYVQVKSFDEATQKYTVRPMKTEVVKGKETESVETTEADLTEWIQITLKGVISDSYDVKSPG